jgi:hypothetical protein
MMTERVSRGVLSFADLLYPIYEKNADEIVIKPIVKSISQILSFEKLDLFLSGRTGLILFI